MANILTVDDSPSIRRMVSYVLTEAGHEVSEGVDGEDGLEVAKGTPFDLVITDINMPKMDGMTLVRRLRELPAYRFTPILVLTTETSQERKMESREAGASGWLEKPFDPDRLMFAVTKVLGRKQGS